MLMRLASSPENKVSTAELADELGLSRNHLAKILQKLASAGIVKTQRGGGGGACLARPPDLIRIGEVVRLLEDGHALVECLGADRGACSLDGRCGLKARLQSAEAAFLKELDRHTLADIALDRTSRAEWKPLPRQSSTG